MKELLEDATAGDPVSGLRWTHKNIRNLAGALRRRGFAIGPTTVARLLRNLKYSLRTNRKRLARTSDPDRDRQFRLLARRRTRYLRCGWPIISVDAKKKELVGNFKNSGVRWCDVPDDVLDHDFPDDAIGRAIPYGIYDEARNTGHVVIGTSHETPEFAVKAIGTWWLKCGRRQYANAPRLRIEADGGGANGSRIWRWKIALQQLADEIGLPIEVSHLPPGASKWNWIEHRMFNLISKNWAGHPLRSYEIMLKHIRSTKSSTGFRCGVSLDKCVYRTKIKVSKEDKKMERLKRDKILPNWNYTISPCKH